MNKLVLAVLVVLGTGSYVHAGRGGGGRSSSRSGGSSRSSTSKKSSSPSRGTQRDRTSSGTGSSSRSHEVSGYTTKRGTVVAPHRQTDADQTQRNNYSTKGNVNPTTGKVGTKNATR